MATLNWVKGELNGRLGTMVGSRWKGKGLVKVFTPPTNPRTMTQQATRATFAFLGEMASIMADPILNGNMFPSPRRMSRMNRMVQINKEFIAMKEVELFKIKMFPTTHESLTGLTRLTVDLAQLANETEMEITVTGLNNYQKYPDAVAIMFYNSTINVWAPVGVFNLEEWGNEPGDNSAFFLSEVPRWILLATDNYYFYAAPIFFPDNSLMKFRGGNGGTVFTGTGPTIWRPTPMITPLAALEAKMEMINDRKKFYPTTERRSEEECERRLEEFRCEHGRNTPRIARLATEVEDFYFFKLKERSDELRQQENIRQTALSQSGENQAHKTGSKGSGYRAEHN